MICRKVKTVLGRIYLFIFRFKYAHYKYNIEAFDGISRRHNRPNYFYAIHYVICSYIYGCDLSEYLIYEFYKLNHTARKGFVTRRNKFAIYKKFRNGDRTKIIFDEKPQFNQHFQPFLKRQWLYSKIESIEEIVRFIMTFQKVVVKPPASFGGKGIRIISIDNIPNIYEFAQKCKEEKLLLEEVLCQVGKLRILNPESVNTIRLICVMDRDRKMHIISTFLRVGQKGSVIDNISSGGIIYPLSKVEGVITGLGVDGDGNKYLYHPKTNIVMPGYKIPKWNEIIKTVKQAMEVIPEARMVAWDICVTESGISIIEGNLTPNPRSMQVDQEGRKRMLVDLA